MNLRFFDFEVLPNWWCCVFGELPNDWRENKPQESIKNNFIVVSSDDANARERIISLMKEENHCLVGYNIKGYDLMIANGIYQGFTPQQIKIINDIIINPSLAYSTKEHLKLASFAKRRMSGCVYLDLYDSSDGTLKDKESTLGLSIRESSVPFDKEHLNEQDKADLIFYCKHDVWAAMVWYMHIVAPFVNSKLAVAKVFGLDEADAYKCTNAQLVAKALNAKRAVFGDEERKDIVLPDKIRDYVNDNLPSEIVHYVCNNIDTKTVKLFDNIVVYADGGIHSTYDTNQSRGTTDVLYCESDSEYAMYNIDVSSFYPSIMIQLGTLSRSIQNNERFKFVFEDRIRIKHKPNKTKDDDDLQLAYKLILNTTYGASGCEFLDLCDKYQRTRTCRYGQLLLTALANKMYKQIPNIKIIQTNTDGILVYVKRDLKDKVVELKDEWCQMSGMGMDIDVVEKIWQRDVNNYLLVKEGGKVKRKGAWLIADYFKPGYIKISPLDCYGVGKAAIDFFIHEKDPMKAIMQNTNLVDFAINCKKGPTYRGCVLRMADGSEIELNKCNRVVATKDKNYGKIYKYKVSSKDGTRSYAQMPNVPDNCMLINDDLSTYDFNEIKQKIDYVYYFGRLLDKLDNVYKQLTVDGLTITHRFDLDI